MRRELVDIVRCPACRAERSFDVRVHAEDAREVREGELSCRRCGTVRGVRGGIVDLMPQAPGFVRREAAGLDRFADVMRASGWDRERVLNLPYEQDGYWYAQATAMHQTLAETPFEPGQRVLDVGSNTCWASAMLAERGLDVIALDINAGELQGLATADWWFEGKGVFFERMLGVMFDVALADASLDWVWCCEVLHHNHRENLARTFAELHRLLRPGGAVLVVNETLRSLRDPKLDPGRDVAEFEGHEHAYLRRTYLAAARAAGFELELRYPWIHPIFGQEVFGITRTMSVAQGFRAAAGHAVRRIEPLRRAYLAWKAYVLGGTSLYLVARKPAHAAPGPVLP